MDSTCPKLPSVFELIASDRLKDSLREAFRYLLEYLRQHDGFKNLPPTDETVLILDLLIEFNHLRAYKSSYSENLYSLVRLSRDNDKISQVLPSLICLTFIPYLRKKLDKYIENLSYKALKTNQELRQIRIHRLLTKSVCFIDLLIMLRFAAGRLRYHNLMNCITGISLSCKTMTVQDMIGDDNSGQYNFSRMAADFMGSTLTVGSYVIQFLDYWNTHSNSTPLFSASLPVPKPPPKTLQLDVDDHNLVQTRKGNLIADIPYTDEGSSSICPICKHVRQNECALSNTGYVFCYKCIYNYVKTRHRCPITGNPATVDNIVKLYQYNDNHQA